MPRFFFPFFGGVSTNVLILTLLHLCCKKTANSSLHLSDRNRQRLLYLLKCLIKHRNKIFYYFRNILLIMYSTPSCIGPVFCLCAVLPSIVRWQYKRAEKYLPPFHQHVSITTAFGGHLLMAAGWQLDTLVATIYSRLWGNFTCHSSASPMWNVI